MFPLFGLYGFILIWLQIMIGPNIRSLKILWPRIFTFHQYEGVTTFLIIASHVL